MFLKNVILYSLYTYRYEVFHITGLRKSVIDEYKEVVTRETRR